MVVAIASQPGAFDAAPRRGPGDAPQRPQRHAATVWGGGNAGAAAEGAGTWEFSACGDGKSLLFDGKMYRKTQQKR